MPIEIVGQFENVDFAEAALVRLGELGIHPQAYRMRSLGIEKPQDSGSFVGMTTGSATIPTVAGVVGIASAQNENRSEPEKKEDVELHLTVGDEEQEKAEGALISSHASRVRPL